VVGEEGGLRLTGGCWCCVVKMRASLIVGASLLSESTAWAVALSRGSDLPNPISTATGPPVQICLILEKAVEFGNLLAQQVIHGRLSHALTLLATVTFPFSSLHGRDRSAPAYLRAIQGRASLHHTGSASLGRID
jgi:hypothetical protein